MTGQVAGARPVLTGGHRPLPHRLYMTDPAAGLGQLLEAVP
jgi:hypothetical protein